MRLIRVVLCKNPTSYTQQQSLLGQSVHDLVVKLQKAVQVARFCQFLVHYTMNMLWYTTAQWICFGTRLHNEYALIHDYTMKMLWLSRDIQLDSTLTPVAQRKLHNIIKWIVLRHGGRSQESRKLCQNLAYRSKSSHPTFGLVYPGYILWRGWY